MTMVTMCAYKIIGSKLPHTLTTITKIRQDIPHSHSAGQYWVYSPRVMIRYVLYIYICANFHGMPISKFNSRQLHEDFTIIILLLGAHVGLQVL